MNADDFQQLLYIVLAPASIVFLIVLLMRVAPTLKDDRNRSFFALTIADIGWLIANWLEAVWPTRSGTVLWMQIAFIFITTLPVAWLEYTIRISGRDHHHPAIRIASLSLVPVVTIIIVFTNSYHSMFWSELRFTSVLGMPFIHSDFGPWFWVHAAYSYSLIAVGAVIVIDAYRGLAKNLKNQARLIILAVILPMAYNVAYITGFLPFLRKDFTAIIFAVSATLFAIASDRYGLFSVVPIARSTLFESLGTAVFVLSDSGRVLDANHAAKDMLDGADPVGTSSGEWKPLELVSRSLGKQGPWEADITLDTKYGRRPFELICVPLKTGKDNRIGLLVTLHDVAVRYEMVKETSSMLNAAINENKAMGDRTLPLCSDCGKARTRNGRWAPLPEVMAERFGISVTHGLCPTCLPRYSGDHSKVKSDA